MTPKDRPAFTIVELILYISLVSVLMAAVAAMTFDLFTNVNRENTQASIYDDSLAISNSLNEAARGAFAVRQTNTITDPHPPAGGLAQGQGSNRDAKSRRIKNMFFADGQNVFGGNGQN